METAGLTCSVQGRTLMSVTARTTAAMQWTRTGFTGETAWNTVPLMTDGSRIVQRETIENRLTWRLDTDNHIDNSKDIPRSKKEKKYSRSHAMTVENKWWYYMASCSSLGRLFLSLSFLIVLCLFSGITEKIWMRKKMYLLFGTEQKRMYHLSLSLLFLARLTNNLVRSLDGSNTECHSQTMSSGRSSRENTSVSVLDRVISHAVPGHIHKSPSASDSFCYSMQDNQLTLSAQGRKRSRLDNHSNRVEHNEFFSGSLFSNDNVMDVI